MWIEKNRIKPKNKTIQARMRNIQRSSPPFSSVKVILKYVKLYCRYSSITTLKYVIDTQRPLFERILWVIIHCIIISILIFMVYISYRDFMMTPLITSMESDSYGTAELDFPGIAICPVNRISRQAVTEFATDIFNKNITDRSLKEILDLLSKLGDLYIANFDRDSSNDMELDQLLMKYYKGSYNIIEIMKNLSPNCSAMLLKCKLHGTYRNCSTLFEFRRTQDGYCCVFNYMRESDDIPIIHGRIDLSDIITETNYIHKVTDLGIERGLTVVMESFVEDYFYSIMPIRGWKIIVFNPTDYPDMTSGGVTEVFAMPLTETYVDVTPTAFFSTNIVKGFTKEKRNCLFKTETETDPQFNGAIYTYSDCIVNCKIQHIQKICGCRPFIYPRRGIEETLWMTIYPHESPEDIYIKEKALHCHNCYPACDDIKYEVLSWKSYMSAGGYNTNLLWDFNVTDQGILHVFFSKYGTIRLKQDVASYWYELMSDIGGICGVFIGFSFITAVELLYFFALMFRDLIYKKSVLDEDDRKDEIPSVQTQTAQTIYWNELVPRSWRSAKYGKFSVNKARY